jgi:hypothetical protein
MHLSRASQFNEMDPKQSRTYKMTIADRWLNSLSTRVHSNPSQWARSWYIAPIVYNVNPTHIRRTRSLKAHCSPEPERGPFEPSSPSTLDGQSATGRAGNPPISTRGNAQREKWEAPRVKMMVFNYDINASSMRIC